MIIREHNRVLFEPAVFYAGGLYREACERRVVEWDEEYEMNITETTKE